MQVSMSVASRGEGFADATLMLQRGCENIPGCIDIAIMRRPAVGALPLPYSKTCDTSRPRRRQRAALRAGLGTPAFVNIDIDRLPSGRFVSQHMPEARPTGIKHGLCHSCFSQFGGAYVANRYGGVLPRNPRGLLVKVVTPGVSDFCVDRPDAFHIAGALSNSQRRFILPVMAQRRDGVASTSDRQFLQAEVDADLAITNRQSVFNFAAKRDIPMPASVLHKAAGPENTLHLPAIPKGVSALQVSHLATRHLQGSGDERDPSQRALSSEAGAETGAPPLLVTRLSELAANGLDGVRMETQIRSAASRQFNEIEGGQPALIATTSIPALALALSCNTEVPHLIAGNSVAIEPPIAQLDPVFERDDRHAEIIPISLISASFGLYLDRKEVS